MSPSLRAEQEQVGDDAPEVFEYVGPVVGEMGDVELGAVNGLVGAFPAEPDVAGVNAGDFEEPVVGELSFAAALDAGVAFWIPAIPGRRTRR
jgi:hypothetical protein